MSTFSSIGCSRYGKENVGSLGRDVVLMDDANDALKKFDPSHDRWDLVITDLTMLNLAGDQLVEKIKESRSDPPIILRTGRDDKIDDIRKLLSLWFYRKPIFGERLIDAVGSVIG